MTEPTSKKGETGAPWPRVIVVCGNDGTGKTSLAQWVAGELASRGETVLIRWRRFNHLTSKPLLALARVVGLTRYQLVDGVRVGRHEFHRSRVVADLFILLQWVDAALVRVGIALGGRLRGGRILILDRFISDILVDLSIDTGRRDLIGGSVGRAFRHLMPPHAREFCIMRCPEEAMKARPEARHDASYAERNELYREAARASGMVVVENDATFEEACRNIWTGIEGD